jgi:hypothetical protein
MKNTILIFAICLVVSYPRSDVRELNFHSTAKSEQLVNKVPFEEKLLTVIRKNIQSRDGMSTHPPMVIVRATLYPRSALRGMARGWEVTLSPDYSTVAYRAKAGGKVFAVVNGKKESVFDDVRYLAFSPAGRKLAYAARLNNKWFIVTGDEKGPEFDRVGPPVFSPDGSRLAYAAESTAKEFLVVDGRKGEEFNDISSPIFSPDGKTLVFVARPIGSKNAALFVDDKKLAEHQIISDVTFFCWRHACLWRRQYRSHVHDSRDKQGLQFDTVYAPASVVTRTD